MVTEGRGLAFVAVDLWAFDAVHRIAFQHVIKQAGQRRQFVDQFQVSPATVSNIVSDDDDSEACIAGYLVIRSAKYIHAFSEKVQCHIDRRTLRMSVFCTKIWTISIGVVY